MQQQNNYYKNQFDFWNDENGEMNIDAEKIQGIQDYDELLSFEEYNDPQFLEGRQPGRSGFYPVLEKSFLFALYYG